MEYNFSDIKKKKVINILDGRDLGNVTDLIFSYPEGEITAFIVSGKKMFLKCEEYIVKLCCINKIGDDAVLVSLKEKCKDGED